MACTAMADVSVMCTLRGMRQRPLERSVGPHRAQKQTFFSFRVAAGVTTRQHHIVPRRITRGLAPLRGCLMRADAPEAARFLARVHSYRAGRRASKSAWNLRND